MKKTLSLLALIALFALSPNTVSAQCGDDEKQETRLVALVFHSDHCGSCKKLKPEVAALQPKLENKPVEWVKFDFTSDQTRMASREKAAELGMADIYDKNQSTGFVLLVDSESRETVARLTARQTTDEMYKIVINKL